jgi:formylglycine-generating enzyme required for sulfatase activity
VRLILFSISSILLLAVTLTAKEPIRTWTSADGRTIEARFIDEKKGKVRIRRTDGRVFNIPLDNLSEEDRKYVESLAVDKPSLSNDQKDKIEDTDSNTTVNDVSEYGKKPYYFVKSALDLEMIWVKPGTFIMGPANPGWPTHKVTLTKGFYLGKFEVTQEQYEKVMGNNPSVFKGYKLPVDSISWYDAVAFCEALTKMELQKNYESDDYSSNRNTESSWKFVLPTEAQWEYACRAGTTTKYSWGNRISPKNANYRESGFKKTVEVGSYSANPWGFFDMHGNLHEWLARKEVLTGGCWTSSATDGDTHLQSAVHRNLNTGSINCMIGFRVSFQQVE